MTKKFALLEAAVSCGSPTRGSEFACDGLINRGLVQVLGDAVCYPMEKQIPCEIYPPHLRHLDTVMAANRLLRENVLTALDRGQFPVIIGGDHSIAMGSLAALGEHYGAENVAVVYVDAHTDINTDRSSVSGCIHGMDLAAACGLCCDELTVGRNKVNVLGENIHIIGARSIDPPEFGIMEDQGVRLCTAERVMELGADGVLAELLPRLKGKRVHISFDVDSLDPTEFSATGYNIPEGLTMMQAEAIMAGVLATGEVCSFECVEYNPTMDPEGVDGDKLLGLLSRLLT
jgi:arginase